MTGDAPIATAKLGSGPKIYVSPTGSDANDGLTPETALASIQLAIDKAVDPGTTICLAAGEYRPTARINITTAMVRQTITIRWSASTGAP